MCTVMYCLLTGAASAHIGGLTVTQCCNNIYPHSLSPATTYQILDTVDIVDIRYVILDIYVYTFILLIHSDTVQYRCGK